ncbi:mannose-binding protein-like [Candoia aspera]|uniref:mannose-binding protein-like n=1 Tax=Candoia aspera TaxID=51853 RepID=UPI002FD8476C
MNVNLLNCFLNNKARLLGVFFTSRESLLDSYTADGSQGIQGPPGKAGPPGSKGDQGVKGEKGDSAELEVLQTQIRDSQAELRALKETTSRNQKAIQGHAFPNFTRIGTKIFASNGAEADFETAKTTCYNFGGQLASLRNSEENDAIAKLASKVGRHAFLGMTDQETEGTFKHLSGDTMEYSGWAAGEANGEHEDYLQGKLVNPL